MTEGVQEIINHRAEWIRTKKMRERESTDVGCIPFKKFTDKRTAVSPNLLDLERRGFEHDSVVGDRGSPGPDGELAFVAFDVFRDPDLRSRQLALEGVFRLTVGVLRSEQNKNCT